jgi:pyruvate kinase
MIDAADLHDTLLRLTQEIRSEADLQLARWSAPLARQEFQASASNLAHYLALRHRDLRPLQRSLMALGLSSLGRLESRVLPSLLAVKASLAALCGLPVEERPSPERFFDGEGRLAANTHEILGACSPTRPVALLVTCPSEAADDPSFMLKLAECGVEAVRINCAHDDADAWSRIIAHLHAAEKTTGRTMKILMDVAGPKIRTGAVRAPEEAERIGVGDVLIITPPGGLDHIDLQEQHFAAECTLAEAVMKAEVGQRVFLDDGKLGARIERVAPWGLFARVIATAKKGAKLKSEKGLNFPDTDLGISPLTDKDRSDLDFITSHADGVGFSFVQSAADVVVLQDALRERRPNDWRSLSIVLKVETPQAVSNLPEIIVQAAGQQPTAVMIARGDLAVEIGFVRLAEIQEEILWIGEAAHTPVIWATQVLEHLLKKGTPSRGEMTDAAMAARAECVMLNKGPYLFEAIAELDILLGRMETHQHKKTPQLRRLHSW